jgi:hypothetical protein
MQRFLLIEEKKQQVIKNHGEEKYYRMLSHLDDPDKIVLTGVNSPLQPFSFILYIILSGVGLFGTPVGRCCAPRLRRVPTIPHAGGLQATKGKVKIHLAFLHCPPIYVILPPKFIKKRQKNNFVN